MGAAQSHGAAAHITKVRVPLKFLQLRKAARIEVPQKLFLETPEKESEAAPPTNCT